MPAPPAPLQITASLVQRARAGDRDAYDHLFALAAERAQLFIRLRLGPRLRGKLDSMDVLQEAYVEASRAFPEFEYRGDGGKVRFGIVRVRAVAAGAFIRAWDIAHPAKATAPAG